MSYSLQRIYNEDYIPVQRNINYNRLTSFQCRKARRVCMTLRESSRRLNALLNREATRLRLKGVDKHNWKRQELAERFQTGMIDDVQYNSMLNKMNDGIQRYASAKAEGYNQRPYRANY
jgi:hypothetical protein